MNVYGYIPANYFPSHSTLTYWAQAASFAGLPSAESTLTAAGFVLGLKKSQLPLPSGDVLHKSRGALSPSSSDELLSVFGVNPQLPAPSTHSITGLLNTGALDLQAHLQHHHHQQQQLRKQQQLQHHHHHFFSRSPPLGSGLAPLQALCQSDVSALISKTSSASDRASSSPGAKGNLKFGMSRILSEDFGKSKCEKENFQLSAVPESCRSLTLCPCNSATCAAYASPPSPYTKTSLPSLSAVHALQPPSYPLSSSADALPGPYSILSTESALANQPKRKRSWSRAVFSNLQRKGLEKRFEVQKYVTKPDRRQLAAMLGLTDAQVKVWFQNRRMKWRHAQQQGEKEKQTQQPDQQQQGEENNQPVSDSCQVLTPGAPTARVDAAVDIDGSECSLDHCDHVSGIDLVDTDSFRSGLGQPERLREAQSRRVRTSSPDLRVGLCVADHLPGDHLTEYSATDMPDRLAATDCCHGYPASVSPGQVAGVSQDNDALPRLPCQHKSPNHLQTASPGYNLDLDNRSTASLDIDSDVEVNDSDVDMIDSQEVKDGLHISGHVCLPGFGVDN